MPQDDTVAVVDAGYWQFIVLITEYERRQTTLLVTPKQTFMQVTSTRHGSIALSYFSMYLSNLLKLIDKKILVEIKVTKSGKV